MLHTWINRISINQFLQNQTITSTNNFNEKSVVSGLTNDTNWLLVEKFEIRYKEVYEAMVENLVAIKLDGEVRVNLEGQIIGELKMLWMDVNLFVDTA